LISKVLPQAGDSWRKRSRKSLSSLRQDAKVGKIRTDLEGYIQTLTYYHAAASSTLRPSAGKPVYTSASNIARRYIRANIALLTVPPLPLTPSSTVPFRRDRDFVDRDILSEIHCKSSQPASRVGLVGLGGVG
jgi:hypothetical protein